MPDQPRRSEVEVESRFIPTLLRGFDGEPPTYVSAIVADTAEAAVTFAQSSGELPPDDVYEAKRVLMRELDPIACKIRGVDEGSWVECTSRARRAQPFWRIDA